MRVYKISAAIPKACSLASAANSEAYLIQTCSQDMKRTKASTDVINRRLAGLQSCRTQSLIQLLQAEGLLSLIGSISFPSRIAPSQTNACQVIDNLPGYNFIYRERLNYLDDTPRLLSFHVWETCSW